MLSMHLKPIAEIYLQPAISVNILEDWLLDLWSFFCYCKVLWKCCHTGMWIWSHSKLCTQAMVIHIWLPNNLPVCPFDERALFLQLEQLIEILHYQRENTQSILVTKTLKTRSRWHIRIAEQAGAGTHLEYTSTVGMLVGSWEEREAVLVRLEERSLFN